MNGWGEDDEFTVDVEFLNKGENYVYMCIHRFPLCKNKTARWKKQLVKALRYTSIPFLTIFETLTKRYDLREPYWSKGIAQWDSQIWFNFNKVYYALTRADVKSAFPQTTHCSGLNDFFVCPPWLGCCVHILGAIFANSVACFIFPRVIFQPIAGGSVHCETDVSEKKLDKSRTVLKTHQSQPGFRTPLFGKNSVLGTQRGVITTNLVWTQIVFDNGVAFPNSLKTCPKSAVAKTPFSSSISLWFLQHAVLFLRTEGPGIHIQYMTCCYTSIPSSSK